MCGSMVDIQSPAEIRRGKNRKIVTTGKNIMAALIPRAAINISPHLKRVATLLCEILMSEKQQQPEKCIIGNTPQCSVATWFRHGRTFDQCTLLQIYYWVCFERIFKIAQNLAKLWRKSWLPQVDCLKRRVRRPLTVCWKISLWDLTDVWRAGTVVTSLRYDYLLLNSLDSVIDKCQTDVMSTTCYSPTDTISDWALMREQTFSHDVFLLGW